ncbi:amidoligase enzyme-domain-containing protein [Penicillium canescens]|uniref:Amidoligase enzyme-domain-containing protein n=1 Tax=Penicillium canescens TaxID=5083 RepID=A0AAD6N3G5_PENCN|nr:amidoligase enzyme-domain-containing protein [Penicillium canescens]KAJ6026606.1 amidoligase enzyme-domain-containing protein [Penicillium canescens]KAJ6039887.1 amidoligase enzyme-domain-containing protein [Penicillium canescens]KAJ6067757.1 amidoligase enzyme-domain-containing protein [Penicillium canescens]
MSRPPLPPPPPLALGKILYELRLLAILLEALASESRLSFFYNLPGRHPRMYNAIDESYLGPRFAEWSLDLDSTIEMPKKGRALYK